VTKLTLETKHGTVSISLPTDEMNIDDLADGLFKPLALSIGYHPDNVAEIFGEEVENNYRCDCGSSHNLLLVNEGSPEDGDQYKVMCTSCCKQEEDEAVEINYENVRSQSGGVS